MVAGQPKLIDAPRARPQTIGDATLVNELEQALACVNEPRAEEYLRTLGFKPRKRSNKRLLTGTRSISGHATNWLDDRKL